MVLTIGIVEILFFGGVGLADDRVRECRALTVVGCRSYESPLRPPNIEDAS